MTEDFGHFVDIRPGRDAESLNLSFWPGHLPLKQRWRNNGLSADFLGDYVTTFFPLDDDIPETRHRQAEIRGAVSYIANELLENAMKFHDAGQPEPITILSLDDEQIVFQESNGASADNAAAFRAFIARLREADPGELYLEQLERNALSEDTAGLGYLTMINDYGAELAWRFEAGHDGGYRVITQVTLKL
ncbi:slr1658 superfamily regulator [Pseudothauera rhizosphaerae]|uniref:ATP-binding protein n=1 Tax=Pseudothauera rhizosphaerae TaxID=2565932 RepID=A0A4V3WBI7_9RHOO|nr:ATP-binding protein [Pseudothauera rhizosphaerae]THF63453.1 ATP-binding protein [Pseudothauera rhizosphaerae]